MTSYDNKTVCELQVAVRLYTLILRFETCCKGEQGVEFRYELLQYSEKIIHFFNTTMQSVGYPCKTLLIVMTKL